MRFDFNTKDLEELLYYSILFVDGDYSFDANLFHYTPIENKFKIITDKRIKLRFTRVSLFQDQLEVFHCIEMLKCLFKRLYLETKICEEFYITITQILNDSDCIIDRLRNWYVFCFTKNPNSEYLIRKYACKNNTDGTILEFHYYSVKDFVFAEDLPISIFEVIYDEASLSSYIETLVLKMYEFRNQDDEKSSIISAIVKNLVNSYGLIFKGATFSNEEEVRIVVNADEIDFSKGCFEKSSNGDYVFLNLDEKYLYNTREVTNDQL